MGMNSPYNTGGSDLGDFISNLMGTYNYSNTGNPPSDGWQPYSPSSGPSVIDTISNLLNAAYGDRQQQQQPTSTSSTGSQVKQTSSQTAPTHPTPYGPPRTEDEEIQALMALGMSYEDALAYRQNKFSAWQNQILNQGGATSEKPEDLSNGYYESRGGTTGDTINGY